MTIDIEQLRQDIEAGTPGPWGWEVSLVSRIVELCGGKGGTDLTVMSFARWGLQGAAPVFWKWTGNTADEPARADKISVPVVGREHHEKWFRRIDHPDARRIARLPDLEAAYLAQAEELARLREAADELVFSIMNSDPWDDIDECVIAYQAARRQAMTYLEWIGLATLSIITGWWIGAMHQALTGAF